jgi:5-aminopentanamidase
VFNSAALIDPGGLRSVYRKAHLWDAENLLFSPGSTPPPVVSTAYGRIGMLICYDLEIPEWVRLPAMDGAQLLCAPVNWPAFRRPDGERPAEVVRVQADAAVNRMFIAACDRTGRERGIDWVGGSVIVDADGWPLAGGERWPLNHHLRVPTRRRTRQGHQPQQQRPCRPASRTVRPPDPDQRSRNRHLTVRVMRL